MRWLRIIFAAATSAAIAMACSSFDEPPATPGGADGGDAGGQVVDASGGEGDAVADASSDAIADDGGACMPKPSGCAGGIVTMLEFASEAVPAGWESDEQNGTVIRIPTPGPCSSADGFLRAQTSIPDADAYGNAYISKFFTGTFQTAHLAFAFRGPKPVTNGYANIGCLIVLRGTSSVNPRTSLRLTLEADKLRYGATVRGADGGTVTNGPDLNFDQAFTPASNEWRKVDVQLVIQTNQVGVSTSYAGMPVGDFSANLLTPATRIDIECGIDYSEEPNASYVHDLDDVFFELCPSP